MTDSLQLQLIETLAAIIGATIAAIGIPFIWWQIRENRKTRQLELIGSVFRDLQELITHQSIDGSEKERKKWDGRFLNTLEWFSFLINKRIVPDGELAAFFDDALIYWYETIFLKLNPSAAADPAQYTEFKERYHRIKLRRLKKK